jgi:hypothetical protein
MVWAKIWGVHTAGQGMLALLPRGVRMAHALIALATLVGTCSATAADQTITVTAAQDTSIYFGTPGSATLSDGSGDYIWLSVTAEGLVRRALLKFDLSAVPPGAVIKQVSLKLYESRARDEHQVALHRLLAPWGEGASNAGGAGTGAPAAPGDATWTHRFYPNTLWTVPGGDFDPVASAVQTVGFANQNYTWTASLPAGGGPVPRMLQDVQSWVNSVPDNHGWILIGAEGGLQNAKRFESRNNAVQINRPSLTVVFSPAEVAGQDSDVPLPFWALAMLAAGLWGGVVRCSDYRFRWPRT